MANSSYTMSIMERYSNFPVHQLTLILLDVLRLPTVKCLELIIQILSLMQLVLSF